MPPQVIIEPFALKDLIPQLKADALFARISPQYKPITDQMFAQFQKNGANDIQKLGLYKTIQFVIGSLQTTGEIHLALQLLNTIIQKPEFKVKAWPIEHKKATVPSWANEIAEIVKNRTIYNKTSEFDKVVLRMVKIRSAPGDLEALRIAVSGLTDLYEKKSDEWSTELVWGSFRRVWENQSFDPKMVDENFATKLVSTTNAINTVPGWQKMKEPFFDFLEKVPFRVEILTVVERVLWDTLWNKLSKPGWEPPKWHQPDIALKNLANLLSTPGFKFEFLGFISNGNFKNNELPDILCLLDSIREHHPEMLSQKTVSYVVALSKNLAQRANTYPSDSRLMARASIFDDLASIFDEPGFSKDGFLFLDKISGAVNLLSALNAFTYFLKSESDAKNFLKIYEKGEELAKKLKLNELDPETCLNLGYGINAIGERKVVALHKNNGIEYFLRYTKAMLEASEILEKGKMKQDVKKGKPVQILSAATEDYNGSFYEDKDKLDALKFSDLVIMESRTKKELYEKIELFNEESGKKISGISFLAHGTEDSMVLSVTSELVLGDKEDLVKLRDAFIDKPTVVLISCSTGKHIGSIGGMFADAWNAKVFAPEEDAALEALELENERIVKVRYVGMKDDDKVQTREYNEKK
ncbi:hypothetical protein HY988_02895 [Candidatus Micrarchaeota archaeon]|nr:hypothetical protein [Candidatus Micrarchaeota archaeon]